ncbi:S-adenosyl-L-methionine-dependent methyltransferase [Pluteus cervinus]|uniref:S-adenosyl-L-methionine-dependent methyltransferase n=1 Tax=Pluteus cervinus TaxID=181527 RepID=A0ACD3B709_9AGAR|nr:S-adenosyl-L-methionine-dependent methyltransferase [Pluteus cervinus]
MLPPPAVALFNALKSSLGSSQATRELKWLAQAARTSAKATSLDDMLARRLSGEPLQYIIGSQPFGPLNLLVRPPVLIPRPETEHWVVSLADALSPTAQNPYKLLDLGTGTGCIPLLLCHLWRRGSLRAHAIDISLDAIELAKENASLCKIPQEVDPLNPRNTFNVIRANMLSPTLLRDHLLDPPYDLITSNPPYISWSEYLNLPESVVHHEDPKALFGGPSGLEFYHAIARLVRVPGFVNPGGVIALEVGHEQANLVQEIMQDAAAIKRTEIWLDPWGKQRTVVAYM